MFIDSKITKSQRRSKERNVARWVFVNLNSAPSNDAGGICLAQTINIRPLTGLNLFCH